MFVITRVGYCEKCKKAHRPKSLDYFIVYGFTRKNYYAYEADCNGKEGYTPHIFKVIEVINKVVFFQMICTMNECGSYIAKKDGKEILTIDHTQWSKVMFMGINDWRALMRFKDTGFEIKDHEKKR